MGGDKVSSRGCEKRRGEGRLESILMISVCNYCRNKGRAFDNGVM